MPCSGSEAASWRKGVAKGLRLGACGLVLHLNVLRDAAVCLGVVVLAALDVAADAADALAVVLIHVRFSLNRIPEHPVI